MLKDIFVQVERAGATVRDHLDFTRRDKTIAEPAAVAKLVESSLKLVENECSLANVESENRIKEKSIVFKEHYQTVISRKVSCKSCVLKKK